MCAAFQDQTEAGQALIQAGADLTIKEYKVSIAQCTVHSVLYYLPNTHLLSCL
jgi:hypothetical protein